MCLKKKLKENFQLVCFNEVALINKQPIVIVYAIVMIFEAITLQSSNVKQHNLFKNAAK
jgi:hypothetical protein